MPAPAHGALLISVHLPKTAGKSFGESLADRFGDRLLRDYADAPLNTPPLARKVSALLGGVRKLVTPPERAECIHGHFLPIKYRWLPLRRPVRFVTWMRDPIERLASHYHFWNRQYTIHRPRGRCIDRWSRRRGPSSASTGAPSS